MLDLKWLIIIPIIFIGYILLVWNNYKPKLQYMHASNLLYATALEETRFETPYVLRKYYSHIIDVKPELIPRIKEHQLEMRKQKIE